MRSLRSVPSVCLAAALVGCAAGDLPAADLVITDRAVGERAPLDVSCDPVDPIRCNLPWPSSSFTRLDDSRVTGVRVDLDQEALAVPDDPSFINHADGFSRITPVAASVRARLDGAALGARGLAVTGGPLRLFIAEPGPDYGREIPVWTESVQDGNLSGPTDLLMGYPTELLPADTELIAVVSRDLPLAEGSMPARERGAELALGLAEPLTQEEADVVGHHAPTRALLGEVGLAVDDVHLAWDFTTRSADDPTVRLAAMYQAVDAAEDQLGVEIDGFAVSSNAHMAAVVRGRITGVPLFLEDDTRLVLDDQGLPQPLGTHDVEFRAVLPANYDEVHVALWGHGMGGSVNDGSFDADFAAEGVAKLNVEFGGWNGNELLETISAMGSLQEGVEASSSKLLQSLSDGHAIMTAAQGPLAEALSAESINGEPNPAAGIVFLAEEPVYVGGSLGGTMGAVIGAADPLVQHGVLNVPAAAWTHMIPDSIIWTAAVGPIVLGWYDGELDGRLGLAMTQTIWDDVDGAAWAEHSAAKGTMYLVQEAIGDEIVPNLGSEFLARSLWSGVVGDPLNDGLFGLERVPLVTAGAAITQYKVPHENPGDAHGFAAESTPAGEAAREQIFGYLDSAWAGQPEIWLPEGCIEATGQEACDFSGMWE